MGMSVGVFPRLRDGWRAIENHDDVFGAIFVRVVAAGVPYYLSTVETDVVLYNGSENVHFDDAIQGDPAIYDRLDHKTGAATARGLSFVVDAVSLPFATLRSKGVLLQDADVDVWWMPVGAGLALDQADHVISGKMSEPVYDETNGVCSFSVTDDRFDGDQPFPPIVADQDRIAGLEDEAIGKPYPVVVGSVKKLPCLCVDAGTDTQYLVAADPNAEFGASAVSAVYDRDDTGPPTISSQSRQTDADGDGYWGVTISAAVTNRDVTADLTGHADDSVEGALRFLLMHYSRFVDKLDFGSLEAVREKLQAITLGLFINDRTADGVLAFIQSRLVPQMPIYMMHRGGKIWFGPRLWDRQVSRVLQTDSGIVRKTSVPVETPRGSIYNSFVVKYGRSGFRGDYTGVVVRDWNNNHYCLRSKQWHGERAMASFDAGDVANAAGANFIIDWLVETYSKMRVRVSYECRIGDVVGVDLWDTIQVYDSWEGWDHGPLFKVIGVRRSTSPTIGLDLVSLDDYSRVYDVPG